MNLEILHKTPEQQPSKGQVVLLHGACMGAWAWEDNFLPWFSEQGYDSYAFSLQNHGQSKKEGNIKFKSVNDYVEDLRVFIASLSGPVYLVGHSMGGFIIQHYLAHPHPHVEKAVLLCASPAQGNWSVLGRLFRQLTWPFILANLKTSWLPVFKGSVQHSRILMFSERYPENHIHNTMKRMQEESFRIFLEMIFLQLPDHKKVRTPLMIIGGEKDFLVTEKDTRKMAALYGVQPHIVSGAPHNIMMEENWEHTADQINRFFIATS